MAAWLIIQTLNQMKLYTIQNICMEYKFAWLINWNITLDNKNFFKGKSKFYLILVRFYCNSFKSSESIYKTIIMHVLIWETDIMNTYNLQKVTRSSCAGLLKYVSLPLPETDRSSPVG